ncbi:winged helix-turn-helix transcriptional regulator [Plantactinospora sp. S1510]|uniref:Winged helix-turn-helix transcriptional regulator n=1 Tax=Plantactinospora alkalitolerans TaxID=2789879 RepID=A0ABS0H225_9ACTN|nr:MarR family winged helix-turn-helix transcriptional regulator [Plantactinospora alkalitolerans]MBF9132278.1 winged helix-turn-helix transcriptional regulator [Plantactinospora alkalitolerans]
MKYEQADALNGAIRVIAIRHRARAAAKLAELGLHPGHEAILLLLDAYGPQTQKQLAVGAGCEPPSITLMVRKLEAAGLLSRRSSTQDARAVVVALTDQGRAVIAPLKELWRDLADETVASLTSTSAEQLLAVLTDLANGLRRPLAGDGSGSPASGDGSGRPLAGDGSV